MEIGHQYGVPYGWEKCTGGNHMSGIWSLDEGVVDAEFFLRT
jgi:hypothetical protein